MIETIEVKVVGAFVYLDRKVKTLKDYEVTVDLPVDKRDFALQYIQSDLIMPALKAANKDISVTRFHTCQIANRSVLEIPIEMDAEEVDLEDAGDLFDASAESVVASEDFSEVEDVVKKESPNERRGKPNSTRK